MHQNPLTDTSIENQLDKCVLDLTGQIVRTDDYPAAHGGFADVWKCTWEVGAERLMVSEQIELLPQFFFAY